MQGPPEVLRRLAAEIDVQLAAALARLLPRLTELHPSLTPVTDEMRAFVGGGKRIRPVLLLLGFEAAGGHTRQDVHGPALALELLHTCALAHDDVIDRAAERRGRPSIHHGFAARHRAADWGGDALDYGEAVAILLGDLAFVQADELFLSAHVPDRMLLAALRRFTVLREEVVVGQYLDLQAATSRTTDRDLALTVATLKSGRYSVARPLEIGAELAGADEGFLEGLRAFGDPLGRAFQVQDDLLGVFGEQENTGKSASSDLVEGKRTLLVAEATTRLGPADRAVLEAGLGDPTLSAERAAQLRELMVGCGARDAAEDYVRDAVTQARGALEDLALPAQAHAHLDAVASYLGDRTS